MLQHQEVFHVDTPPPLVPLAVLAFAAGCDENLISVSSDGRIEVSVSTNGSDSTPTVSA